MITKTINLYSFDELSKEAQDKALNDLSDINVDHEWWDYIYEDAERIGLKITGFDLDRNRHATGEFTDDAMFTAEAIKINHGEDCETYKTAVKFLSNYTSKALKFESENERFYFQFEDLAHALSEEFLTSLLEDYSIMLQKECDYLMSLEAIIETIKSNEYTFTETGKLENL